MRLAAFDTRTQVYIQPFIWEFNIGRQARHQAEIKYTSQTNKHTQYHYI